MFNWRYKYETQVLGSLHNNKKIVIIIKFIMI